MTTFPLLPSATKALIAWAKDQADLEALHGGRVGTKIAATLPCIRVQRIGGIPDDQPVIDEPLLQVDCWGVTEGDAEDVARTLVAVLPSFRGVYAGGTVHGAGVEAGPFSAPDDPNLSTNIRFTCTVRVLTTP